VRIPLVLLVLGVLLFVVIALNRFPPLSESTPSGAPRPALRVWSVRLIRIAALVMAFMVLLLLLENSMIFFPSRYPEGDWRPPHASVEDCFFETADGVRLHAWWLPGARPESGPVLLWFHGNAGNITHRGDNLAMFVGRDASVLLVDYRGYGRSEGKPSEKGIYLDGEAAYEYVTRERGVPAGRVICFGRSIGCAVALHVALKYPVAGLVLESPFTSARAMARRMLPLLPVWLFIRSEFDNIGRVPSVKAPVLVIHGDRDEVVPFEQGRAVFDAAPEPKEFYCLEGARHNDTYLVGGAPYMDRLLAFCSRCTADAAQGDAALRR